MKLSMLVQLTQLFHVIAGQEPKKHSMKVLNEQLNAMKATKVEQVYR